MGLFQRSRQLIDRMQNHRKKFGRLFSLGQLRSQYLCVDTRVVAIVEDSVQIRPLIRLVQLEEEFSPSIRQVWLESLTAISKAE